MVYIVQRSDGTAVRWSDSIEAAVITWATLHSARLSVERLDRLEPANGPHRAVEVRL